MNKDKLNEAAVQAVKSTYPFQHDEDFGCDDMVDMFIKGHEYAINNPWTKTEDESPNEKVILAKLSEAFCYSNTCYKILHWRESMNISHPEGYYDEGGENIPTSAIEYWMKMPEEKSN